LSYTDVGFRVSVFLYRLSGDLPRFSRLLVQLLPECLKLVIPAVTLFTVCHSPYWDIIMKEIKLPVMGTSHDMLTECTSR
jgi:hypothetical protein